MLTVTCLCVQVLQTCGSPELVRSIVSPHLSKDAVDFLRGHLTPKETSIFDLLGEAWTKPRFVDNTQDGHCSRIISKDGGIAPLLFRV